MNNFTYNLNTRLIFGTGEFARLGEETRNLGRKGILVTGKSSMRKLGVLDRATQLLERAGVQVSIFAEVESNPRSTTVDRGARQAREFGAEVVISLGGGSALDAAKGIAVAALSGRPIWDFIYSGDGRQVASHRHALPIVAVPTVAAAGSEFGGGSVITNWETHEKALLLGDHIFPRVSIIDPQLMTSVPPRTTGEGGIDIIAHALDNYISNTTTTPLQDRFSEGIFRTVIDYLESALKDGQDLEARTQLAWASVMANSGIVHNGRNGAGPMHFIEHTLSGHFDISHARGLAVVMPALFRFNNEGNPAKYAQLARNVFFITDPSLTEQERGERAIECLETWLRSVDMYTRLSELGITESCFEKIAEDTLRVYEIMGGSDGALLNPARRLDKAGIIEVLRGAA